ncbi:uncharacterized protein LOC127243162 [Andrographis paniculata]|uniref:uncharacterized protein LOC127243162 n=1 Tax=Andrographis paniculata TaxID=175694 RepID=UPI0021E7E190|nr:uncharacterized protein LOC127243162 [Andrographis paniculata]XP_051119005.1 uncharacterized protein LOC127243162 [Andrographis paniculata]XP_051119006.1 uncharacterized protein LOC127243162 [Andrographis paniculata]
MELSFDKYCFVDTSPTTVLLPPRQHSRVSDKKSSEGKPKNRNYKAVGVSCGDDEPLKARLLRKTEAVVGREKIDFSGGTTQSAAGIIDSLCSMDKNSLLVEQKESSAMSLSELSKKQTVFFPQDFKTPSESAAKDDTNIHSERVEDSSLHKSLSLLLTLSHSPDKPENDGWRSSSPTSRARKILRPFLKSKPHRSPLSSSNRSDSTRRCGLPGNHCKKTTLMLEAQDKQCNVALQNSAAHLHGLLKFKSKQREPSFEFSVKTTEDVYIGKTWKVENDVTRVYTLHHRRKTNAGGESSMVGQMRVSCRMCSEFNGDGELNNSLVTEFVLYDVIHSRESDNPSCSLDVSRAQASPDSNEIVPQANDVVAAEASPEIEIGAVVVQVSLGKQGSLRMMKHESEAMEGIYVTSQTPKMHVVIPAGSHGGAGPSPLLERWRLGGGCDCGGWDMACPLVVLSNHKIDRHHRPFTECSRNLAELFVQGKKENRGAAAFAMRATEEDGKYAVDFHAQLSSLQAFFICMAVLHTARSVNEPSLVRLFAENTRDAVPQVQFLPSLVLDPPSSPISRA